MNKQVTLTPQSDADGICASQTPAGAGNLTIAGALASTGTVTLNHGHLVLITCAGADAGRTFTITGTDFRGETITEAISGSDAGTSQGSSYFKSITQVAVDAATADAITIGVNGLSASNWYPLDIYKKPFDVSLSVVLSGTTTYTIQHTFDDVQVLTDLNSISTFNHASLAAKTVSDDGNYAYPCVATRIILTSYTSGTTKFTVIQ